MSAANWFWIVYVLVVLGCCGLFWPFAPDTRRAAGVSLAILILLGILGWGIFGPPIK